MVTIKGKEIDSIFYHLNIGYWTSWEYKDWFHSFEPASNIIQNLNFDCSPMIPRLPHYKNKFFSKGDLK